VVPVGLFQLQRRFLTDFAFNLEEQSMLFCRQKSFLNVIRKIWAVMEENLKMSGTIWSPKGQLLMTVYLTPLELARFLPVML